MSLLIGKYFSFFILGFDLLICLAQILYGTFCLIYMSMTNKELTLAQQNITIPPLVQLLCGIVILFTIIVACCGLAKEITCCVNIYSVIFLAVAILQIAMGTFAWITFTRDNKGLKIQIENDLNITYKRYSENPTLINNIQTLIHCCGRDSPSDMIWNTTVSRSCCSDVDLNCNLNSTTLYRDGCVNEVIDFVIRSNNIIAYSSISSGIVQALASMLGFCVGCHLHKYGTTYTM